MLLNYGANTDMTFNLMAWDEYRMQFASPDLIGVNWSRCQWPRIYFLRGELEIKRYEADFHSSPMEENVGYKLKIDSTSNPIPQPS